MAVLAARPGVQRFEQQAAIWRVQGSRLRYARLVGRCRTRRSATGSRPGRLPDRLHGTRRVAGSAFEVSSSTGERGSRSRIRSARWHPVGQPGPLQVYGRQVDPQNRLVVDPISPHFSWSARSQRPPRQLDVAPPASPAGGPARREQPERGAASARPPPPPVTAPVTGDTIGWYGWRARRAAAPSGGNSVAAWREICGTDWSCHAPPSGCGRSPWPGTA